MNYLTPAARRKVQLIYRSKRIASQFEMIHRALQQDADRKEVLERVSDARYSVIDLLAQLLEEEILDRPHEKGKSKEEIVNEMMAMLKEYVG
jgi:DNA-binding FrmR family transcriptional regulator